MYYRIKKPHSNLFLATAIDSSGMDVVWTNEKLSDYLPLASAESFLRSLESRYPSEKFQLVPA